MINKNIGRKNQSGSNPSRGVVAVQVGRVTIAIDATEVAGVVGSRGAEPPAGGAAVIIGNALVISGTACTRTEVRELCTVTR